MTQGQLEIEKMGPSLKTRLPWKKYPIELKPLDPMLGNEDTAFVYFSYFPLRSIWVARSQLDFF